VKTAAVAKFALLRSSSKKSASTTSTKIVWTRPKATA